MGSVVGSFPPNSNMKHYKAVEILSKFQNVKSTCANVKPPIESFLATVLVQNPTSFRFSLRSGVWKSNKHANRGSSSCNNLGRFTWRVLLVCATFLWPWQASINVVLKLCFNVFIPWLICVVCLIFLITDKKKQMWNIKNVGHVFCQTFNLDVSSWFACKNYSSCSR